MDKISVIIPCYNEEETIPLFHKEITKVFNEMNNVDYELLFINDGSKDHTIDILKTLSIQDNHCDYYSFSRNFGKEAAMYAGLKQASGDYVVIMDSDLQHPPHLLKEMYNAVSKEGFDCCAGKRVSRDGEGKLRNFLSKCFYALLGKISKLDMDDGVGDFRMMSRQMVDAILEFKEYNRYMKGLFSVVGFDTKWVEFHNVARAAGTTKWNFGSLFSYAMEGIFSFTTAPIMIAGVIGGILLFIACIMILIILITLLMNSPVNDLLLISTLILFLSGLQMFFISLIGQYTSRGYMESKNRPIYIIKESNKKVSR